MWFFSLLFSQLSRLPSFSWQIKRVLLISSLSHRLYKVVAGFLFYSVVGVVVHKDALLVSLKFGVIWENAVVADILTWL